MQMIAYKLKSAKQKFSTGYDRSGEYMEKVH